MTDRAYKECITRADSLAADGRVTAAVEEMLSFSRQHSDNPHYALNIAIWLNNKQLFNDHMLSLLDRAWEAYSGNPEFLFLYAQAAMMIGKSDESVEFGAQAALRAISLSPQYTGAYDRLIRIRLLQGRYTEAYLVGLAARHIHAPVQRLDDLAEHLMKGVKALSFNYQGMEYRFMLSTLTPACIHGCTEFLKSRLFEEEELAFTKTFVGQVSSILEIGTLLGNHTAYYQRNLKPTAILCIEANPELADLTRWVAKNNQDDEVHCDTKVENAWADREEGVIDIRGQEVRRCTVDALSDTTFDFIKIDVDGAEMSVLTGAEATLAKGQPKLMIEASDENQIDVKNWLAERGFSLIHTVPHQGYANHFLERTAG